MHHNHHTLHDFQNTSENLNGFLQADHEAILHRFFDGMFQIMIYNIIEFDKRYMIATNDLEDEEKCDEDYEI